jgi:hypothetical protein
MLALPTRRPFEATVLCEPHRAAETPAGLGVDSLWCPSHLLPSVPNDRSLADSTLAPVIHIAYDATPAVPGATDRHQCGCARHSWPIGRLSRLLRARLFEVPECGSLPSAPLAMSSPPSPAVWPGLATNAVRDAHRLCGLRQASGRRAQRTDPLILALQIGGTRRRWTGFPCKVGRVSCRSTDVRSVSVWCKGDTSLPAPKTDPSISSRRSRKRKEGLPPGRSDRCRRSSGPENRMLLNADFVNGGGEPPPDSEVARAIDRVLASE